MTTRVKSFFSDEMKPTTWIVRYSLTGVCLLLVIMAVIFSVGAFSFKGNADIIEIPANVLKLENPVPLGKSLDLKFAIKNNSNRQVIIIGSNDFCSMVCLAGQNLPLTLEPGASSMLVVHLSTNATGSFSEKLTFFTSIASQPTLEIKIEGDVYEQLHTNGSDL